MKIVLSSAGPFDQYIGGGQVYVQRLACNLQSRGHDVTVLAPIPWAGGEEDVAVQRSSYEGVSVIGLCANPSKVPPAERALELGTLLAAQVRQLLAELSPEVAHINGWKAIMTRACNDAGIPHVVTAHHPGVACPNGTLLTAESNICRHPMSAKVCVPCVCRQLRGGTRCWPVARSTANVVLSDLWDPPALAECKLCRPRAHVSVAGGTHDSWQANRFGKRERFIAPSKAIKAALVRNGLSEERVVVVPHGIEPLRKTPIEVIDGRPIRFGYVGRINRPKGLHILFQAFASLLQDRPCELHIIGAGNIGGKRTTWQMPCPVAQTTKGLYCMGKFRMTACTRPWRRSTCWSCRVSSWKYSAS